MTGTSPAASAESAASATEPSAHDPIGHLSSTMLEGHVAFITGGGSGINLGIARAFARCGAAVALCGRTEERLAGAAEELRGMGAQVAYKAADVRDPEALQASVDHAVSELGDISITVAGAAGNFFAKAEEMSSNAFRTVVDIDLMGAYHAAKATFPSLQKTRGSILFISASQAFKATKYQAHVGAAKAGIEMLMQDLAVEWGEHGIRSNSLVPGPVAGTEGMTRLAGPTGDDMWKRAVPLGRYAETEEVGAMAAVLAGPLGAYVTGSQYTVDGGLGLVGSGHISEAVEKALFSEE
ncbi:SDR family oxidoreductase [Brevibacterium jeotgali]|uniref:NAD(P)-dependent dehydrogenase, short-chain alcohol dehydrogenase family n=1 Tax=Brevibacterium jeotgali TaxID=1262550 RepID=A0A2H1L4R6_9MICO|nr:SDR family oxidoreductase [Brevibacterium jeotgali]TWC01501.1 NAD(P)-dependent dehydrogenase (short-subunit alcohol dehydrogenase family) [Brevibacterium jeotgali]SMY11894.1 NAD(P)-dependent dehydrogenase, short-chain alcohol dehydrogenase family [Brevibacterium jeotgali]